MKSRVRPWRAPAGLLGIALTALVALAVIDAHVEPPGGGCFGSPPWFGWVSSALVPVSVLAASVSAGAFGVGLRWPKLVCAAFALAIAALWLVVLALTLHVVEGPC